MKTKSNFYLLKLAFQDDIAPFKVEIFLQKISFAFLTATTRTAVHKYAYANPLNDYFVLGNPYDGFAFAAFHSSSKALVFLNLYVNFIINLNLCFLAVYGYYLAVLDGH